MRNDTIDAARQRRTVPTRTIAPKSGVMISFSRLLHSGPRGEGEDGPDGESEDRGDDRLLGENPVDVGVASADRLHRAELLEVLHRRGVERQRHDDDADEDPRKTVRYMFRPMPVLATQ